MYNTIGTYLKEWKEEKKRIKIFTMNGFQLRGTILDYDEKGIVVYDSADYKKKVLFYHAISTIQCEEN